VILKARRRSIGAAIVVLSLPAVFVVGPAYCQEPSDVLVSTDRRTQQLNQWVFDHLCEAAGPQCSNEWIQTYGYRMSRFRPVLLPGDRVRPVGAPEESSLVCQYRCSLFFLDLVPGAHFEHPTVVGLFDLETGELQTLPGEWWPVVNERRHVLETANERIWSAVKELAGATVVSTKRRKRPSSHKVPLQGPDRISGQLNYVMDPTCKVKAVVVNGYKTSNNTFDVDADGMYQVLRGLGFPDDRIVYLGPYATPGRDDIITPDTLRTALKNAAASDPTCEEFVFFISTHSGHNDVLGPHLQLRQSNTQHQSFDGIELAQLLSAVSCDTLTLIIGGCDNSVLKSKIECEMNKAGKPYRLVMSSGDGLWSWADLDVVAGVKDTNPEDKGSETVWGYIESLGTSSADQASDFTVSFDDAAVYALLHDLSKQFPAGGAVSKTLSPVSTDPAHPCCEFGALPGARIVPNGLATLHKKKVDGVSVPAVKRCTNAPITVKIENLGDSRIPVGTIRLHGSRQNPNTGTWEAPVALADVAIATDLVKGTPQTYKLYWGVRPTYQVGDRVKLYATVDSPLDPVDFAACVQNGFGTTGCPPDQQWAELEVVVKKRCPLSLKGCNCLEYAGPDL
jgi:hypothetical protein